MCILTFLQIETILAILNLFGKIHVVNIWLVISVNDFIRVDLANFNNGEETPSKPHKLNMFLFMGLCICVARFGPIRVKQLLNMFDMSVLSLMISSLHENDLVKVLFVCVLERILLIGSNVFYNISLGRQGGSFSFLLPFISRANTTITGTFRLNPHPLFLRISFYRKVRINARCNE